MTDYALVAARNLVGLARAEVAGTDTQPITVEGPADPKTGLGEWTETTVGDAIRAQNAVLPEPTEEQIAGQFQLIRNRALRTAGVDPKALAAVHGITEADAALVVASGDRALAEIDAAGKRLGIKVEADA